MRFNPTPSGPNSYEVQRKRTGANDNTYVPLERQSPPNRFIDPTELANGVSYTYRVRVNSAEGMSEWSKEASKTAMDFAPLAGAPEAYTVVTTAVTGGSANAATAARQRQVTRTAQRPSSDAGPCSSVARPTAR